MNNIVLVYLKYGVLNQSISVYNIDESTGQLSMLDGVSAPMSDLESTILSLSKKHKANYINILNDKELEKEYIEKYNFKTLEDYYK